MALSNAAEGVNKTASKISWAVNYLGMVALAGMMFLTAADVIGRYLLDSPVTGAFEVTQMLMVLVAFCTTAQTQVRKGHVGVDFFVNQASKTGQSILRSTTDLLSVFLFPVVSWQCFVKGLSFTEQGLTDSTLHVPLAPFMYVIGVGTAILSLVLIGNYLSSISKNVGKHREIINRVIPSVVVVAIVAAVFVWSEQLPPIEPLVAGGTGFLLMLIFMFMGIPVAFSMFLVGMIGMAYLRGIDASMSTISEVPYRTSAHYEWCVIPLFILMGYIVFYAGLGKDLYETTYKWIGRLKGGLAEATVAACAIFGAIVGTTQAGVVTFGTIALPEMKRYKYDAKLATGCIAAAGTLATMIPPSNGFIIWGLLTETSVGDMFMAGILPGIMLTIMFILLIYVRCRFNPLLGPAGPAFPMRERLASLNHTLPVAVLFIVVIGGLYAGVFTPTEGGGIGAFGALIIALAMRRLSGAKSWSLLLDSVRLCAMVFMLLIGGNVFAKFLAASKLPLVLADSITALNVHPLLILGVMLVLWIALGCVMPGLPITILTVPILLPVFLAMGYNLIWLGVLHQLCAEMGVITPPVGINVYVLAGIAKDVPMETIFRGIFPFFYTQLVGLVILIFVPIIPLYLPTLLR